MKYEYELYVEREIENYKDSVPRSALLSIGDEAIATLHHQPQLTLTELVLCEEVDRIIMKRLRIPTYRTWRTRCYKTLEEYRRPEHWGLLPESILVRAIHPDDEAHVLVAGDTAERVAVYFAANGCDVTAIDIADDAIDRVLTAAGAAGLAQRVRPCVTGFADWQPDVPLNAVVCTPAALSRLTPTERRHVIELLQSATADGGVHLVETIVAGHHALTLSELREQYAGWEITVERAADRRTRSFVARKNAA